MNGLFFPYLSYGEAVPDELKQLRGDNTAFPPSDGLRGPCDIDDLGIDFNPPFQTQEHEQLSVDGNAEIWTTLVQHRSQNGLSQPSYAWDLPARDATACIWMANSLPSPLMSNESYPSLDVTLRDELIKIYFENVHPLCPIIDEQNFCWHYYSLTETQFIGLFPSIMFNAMIFAAFAVSSDIRAIISIG